MESLRNKENRIELKSNEEFCPINLSVLMSLIIDRTRYNGLIGKAAIFVFIAFLIDAPLASAEHHGPWAETFDCCVRRASWAPQLAVADSKSTKYRKYDETQFHVADRADTEVSTQVTVLI